MRLKIKISGSPFGDPGKDRSRNEPAVIQLWFARVRIVEYHKANKLRMLGRQIADERDDVLSVFISTFRINLLCGPSLAGDRRTRASSGGRSTSIAYDASERIPNFSGSFRRNYLTQYYRGKRAHGFAIGGGNRFYDARCDQFAAIGNRRHCHGHLQWRDPDFVPHWDARDRNFAPRSRRTNKSVDLTGELNSGALTKSEAADVFVKLLFANVDRELGCADVARLDENVAHAQVRERAVIVQGGATEIPETIFAKDGRIRPELAFIERGGGRHDFEGRTRLHHIDDGAIFHFLGLCFGAEV